MKKDDRLFNISTNGKSSENYGKLQQVDLRLHIRNNFPTMRAVMLDMTCGKVVRERFTYICVV